MKLSAIVTGLTVCGLSSLLAQQAPNYVAPPAAPAMVAQAAPAYKASAPAPATTTATAPAPTPAPPPSTAAKLGAAELEKLAMPIALHPDSLLAILLPAAVYPVEVVQAARFVKDTNNIPRVDSQPWDDNVKAAAKIPALIAQMDADLDWTIRLGKAFLDQPKELMDAIQALRAKAQKAGTLQNSSQQVVVVTNVVVEKVVEKQVVVVTNTVIEIQSSNPQVVYVPSYPTTVYYPPPGYVYNPYAPLVTFGVGIAVGAIIANNCDWHGGGIYVGHHGVAVWGGGGYHSDVDIDIDRDVNRERNVNRGERPTPQSGNRAGTTGAQATQQKWQPDQSRMRSSGAANASISSMESRGWSSGATRPSTQPATGARPSTGAVGAGRLSTGNLGSGQPGAGNLGSRPTTSPSVNRPSPSQSAARSTPASSNYRSSSGSGNSAFSGVSSGSNTRSYSNRGASSRSSGGGFRGGGGGRGGRGR